MKALIAYRAVTIIYLILIFNLSSQSSLPTPALFPGQDKIFHILEFAVLGFLIHRSLDGGASRKKIAVASVLSALFGFSDELHQAFVPGRQSCWMDFMADASGSVLGAVMSVYIKGFFQRSGRLKGQR